MLKNKYTILKLINCNFISILIFLNVFSFIKKIFKEYILLLSQLLFKKSVYLIFALYCKFGIICITRNVFLIL